MGPNNVPNGSFIESTSRPPTPPAGALVEEEERKKKKSKSKKRKKHKNERKELALQETAANVVPLDVPIPPYYQQFHQIYNQPQLDQPISPITLSISKNYQFLESDNVPLTLPPVPVAKVQIEPTLPKQEVLDTALRASKRRRVPNKFYGYSSEEEQEKASPAAKWRKTEVSLSAYK